MREDDSISGPMHERIRRRREERGVPAYALAQRLAISPSYISLIEAGKKVPGEDIARRIAEALDDDVEMYVAWAHASGINDLDVYTDRLMRLRHHSSDPVLRRQLRSGEDIAESTSRSIIPRLLRSRLREPEPSGQAAGELEVIPLLDEGVDPAATGSQLRVAGPPLRLDARMFANAERGRLFAYRATPDMAMRAGGSVRPGDWLILTSRVDVLDTEALFAVRNKGRIVLSRLLVKGKQLLLLPPPGTSDFEIVEFRGEADLPRVLAGRVVMKLRGM